MEIVLDESLKPNIYSDMFGARSSRDTAFLPQLIGRHDRQSEAIINNKIDENDVYHLNYTEYLAYCYSRHLGVIITPDILWYTVLTEIAGVIKAEPEAYRRMFTDSAEKKTILVPTDDLLDLPLHRIVEGLERNINFPLMILPRFSTSTDVSQKAFHAAFADMASPYYNYMTYACGIPKIKILGDMTDYNRLFYTLRAFDRELEVFGRDGSDALREYFAKITPVLEYFMLLSQGKDEPTHSFLKDMFHTKKCGSGSQKELFGWWVRNMFVKDYTGQTAHNTPTMVSRVHWKNMETGRTFVLNTGLLSSKIEDDYLIPQWGEVISETGLNLPRIEPDSTIKFTVHKTRVDAESRMLQGRVKFIGPDTMSIIPDGVVEMLPGDDKLRVKYDDYVKDIRDRTIDVMVGKSKIKDK